VQAGATPGSYVSTESTLTLVDLAGSEDISRSGVEGGRLREAAGINAGLLALHRVVEALGSGAGCL
jgi:hypothetical protein